ncbi:MAG TPA: AMP-binding protein [Ktedonobacteraceae bacterium]|jgi:putative adenylate-forming enzyme
MSQVFSQFLDLEQTGSPLPEREHERWKRQLLAQYQTRALQICREYAYAHSPFYQRFHQGLKDRPLQELPVLSKSVLMEHFDELVTDRTVHLDAVKQYMAQPAETGYFLDRYRTMATSGSSGTPAIFLYNQAEWATVMASLGRLISWLDPTARSKPALLAAPGSWSMTVYIQKSMATRDSSGVRFSVADPLPATVQRLNEAQPTVIMAYPSVVRMLAGEQSRGQLHIAPRAVVCSSEQLTGEVRRQIEEAWHIQPHNLYATTEGGLLAAECAEHQGLHIFEDLVILEVVDHNNRPVPAGTPGDKVLLTVLFGRTLPLIRYELTDSVGFSTHPSCPCGRPFALLEDPRGRIWETLFFSSPAGTEVAVHPMLFGKVIDLFPVSGWQIVQTHDGVHVLVSGARAEQIDEALLGSLRTMLGEQGIAVPALSIEHVAAIPRSASGKIILVSSRLSRSAV